MSDRKEDLSIYKKALEVLTMPVLLVGSDEHIIFMNKAYGEFLGVDPEKIIGKVVLCQDLAQIKMRNFSSS